MDRNQRILKVGWLGLLLSLCLACSTRPLQVLDSSPRVGELRVMPKGDQQIFSMGQGEYLPKQAKYHFGNYGDRQFDYELRCNVPWLRLSKQSGRLQPDGRAELLITVIEEQTRELLPGWHRAQVSFVNSTNGKGDATRELQLLMRSEQGLEVLPSTAWAPSPGAASSQVYQLTNASPYALEWEVEPHAKWLSVEPSQGVLAAGASVEVSATCAATDLATLKPNQRSASIGFYNRTDGVGTTLRKVSFAEQPEDVAAELPAGERLSSISQYGITWNFAEEVRAGRYLNGDWWVQGPVLVQGIAPRSRSGEPRTRHGSMINPSPKRGLIQGYDSAAYDVYKSDNSYSDRLNVALDVDLMHPLLLGTGRSLVSSISEPEPGRRPQLKTAAVLTCVEQVPPKDAFRPPYSGTDKRSYFVESQLKLELLSRLKGPPKTPSFAAVEQMLERPWIDHVPLWVGRYLHPTDNMENYGREICDVVSTASLMLHLDVSASKKRTLLIRFVQLGIDLHGILQDGGSWRPEGGHMSGRKWPILFAGLMLGDARMQSIGVEYGPETFAEDGQTFYVGDPRPALGYREEHRGMAEWGVTHARSADNDDVRWRHTDDLPAGAKEDKDRTHDLKYRLCCTANTWWGELLAARIMGAKELWNHPALFDYQDRFFEVNQSRKIFDQNMSLRKFYLQMWRRYRKDY